MIGDAGIELHRAHDPARDQSYFLYGTSEAQLDYLRFPLGGLPKSEVRNLAESAALRNAAKPDSQDIWLRSRWRLCPASSGRCARKARSPDGLSIVESGEVLGSHRGVLHYTVGQRRGLEIGGQAEPLYVISIDAASAEVRVGPKHHLAVGTAQLIETNRIGPLPAGPLTAKVRSLAKPVPIALDGPLGGGAATMIHFPQPEYGVAPGTGGGDLCWGPGSRWWLDRRDRPRPEHRPRQPAVRGRQSCSTHP